MKVAIRPVAWGAILGVLALLFGPGPSQAGSPLIQSPLIQEPSIYRDTVKLVNAGSGLCASPAGGGGLINGAAVQFFCDADPARLWYLVPSRANTATNPVYQIKSDATLSCLSPAGGGLSDRTPIVMYYCDDAPARQWVLTMGTNDVVMGNKNSGLCLTVDGGAGANAGLLQSGCDSPQARWQLSTGDFLRNVHSGLCLAPTGSVVNAAIVQGSCVDSYRIRVNGDGTLYIRDNGDQLCLSPAGGATDKNVLIVQYFCDPDPARGWTVTRRAGAYEIRNAHSGMCLSPAGGAATAATLIVQYFCDGDPSRLWTLVPELTTFVTVGH